MTHRKGFRDFRIGSNFQDLQFLGTITTSTFALHVLMDRKRDPDPFPISVIVISWVTMLSGKIRPIQHLAEIKLKLIS